METNIQEIWKDVPGYEGIYQASTFGRIKSLPNPGNRHYEIIMIPFVRERGYKFITLIKNGIKWGTMVHRVIGITFIDNPLSLPYINHKDENPSNNHVDNLEWCTPKYNSNYGTGIKRNALARINGIRSKKVYKFSLDGEYIEEYPSLNEVGRKDGFNIKNISSVCLGRRKYANGFKWSYKKPN